MVVAAGGLVATVTAGQAITDPVWNPFASLLPFAGLLLVSWAVAAGELRWWPVAVFLGSFCAQTHLTYAVPALLVVVVAPVVGYTVVRATEHRPPVRPAVVGALVAVAAWSGPVWQQLTGETGNLSMLRRTVSGGQDEVVGTGRALRMLAYGITGRPPAWLDGPTRDSAERTQGVSASSPWLAVVVVLLLLLALVAALRRQDRITAGVDVVALAACTGFVLGIRGASGPHVELTLWYMLTALIPIGMFTCLALGWSAWRLVIRDRVGARRRARGMAPPIAIGALAVCSLLITVWMGDWGPHSWDSHPTGWPHTRAVSRDVLGLIDTADLTPGRLAVGIDSLGPGSQSVRRGVAYGLATRGWTPTMSEHDLKMLDDDRFRAQPDDRRLVMVDQPAPASGDLLGEVHDPMTGRDMSLYIVRP